MRAINLVRFEGFIKSLDLIRTKENYEELIKIKHLQVKFLYKQQCVMDMSETMIFLINNLEEDIEYLNEFISEALENYLNINNQQDIIKKIVKNFELANQEFKKISNKIDLVLKDGKALYLNCVLNEQDYLLTKSYLANIKNRFRNQLNNLEQSYEEFKSFINL